MTEMMSSPVSAPRSSEGAVLLESGVLACRRGKNGEPQILLISKKGSKNWGIPKGRAEPHLSFGENAAKEAYEEAGVLGNLSTNAIGMFRARKRSHNPRERLVIEVWIYLLLVTQCLANWPEEQKRKTKWVSCEYAAAHLREPVLADLCHRLAQS